jgi:hypothetical protein
MATLDIEGHYDQRIDVDHCPTCHLIWFDDTEAVRLSGLGWVTLLSAVHASPPRAQQALPSPLPCPRCGAACKPIRNQSRFGRSGGEECARHHGYWQGYGQLLAERGLVRPLRRTDRPALARQRATLTCLNCGAQLPEDPRADRCAWCASPVLVLDVRRLVASLLMRHGEPLPADGAEPVAWSCRACGDAVDPTTEVRCRRCGHPVLAPSLDAAMPLVRAAEPQLRAQHRRGPRPHGERLRRQRGFRDTAFYRHVVRPLGYEHVHGRAAAVATIALLGALIALVILARFGSRPALVVLGLSAVLLALAIPWRR